MFYKTSIIVESSNKKDFIISIKYSNWSSGGVVAIKAAQSGQALRPFESQIPGSNPGRSIGNLNNFSDILAKIK